MSNLLDEFLKQYNIFKIEMNSGLESHKYSKWVHVLSDKDAFSIYIWIVWIIGLL